MTHPRTHYPEFELRPVTLGLAVDWLDCYPEADALLSYRLILDVIARGRIEPPELWAYARVRDLALEAVRSGDIIREGTRWVLA